MMKFVCFQNQVLRMYNCSAVDHTVSKMSPSSLTCLHLGHLKGSLVDEH